MELLCLEDKTIKKKTCQPRILYWAKGAFRKEGKIHFSDKQWLREFATNRSGLKKILRGILYVEKKIDPVGSL